MRYRLSRPCTSRERGIGLGMVSKPRGGAGEQRMIKAIEAADLRGIFPAIPTPVTGADKVDPAAVAALIDYVVAGGVSGLVPLGGTGEYGSLSREQRER